MRRRVLVHGVLAAGVALFVSVQAWSYPEFAREHEISCASCHTNPAGGADLTDGGKAFKADAKKVPADVKGADYVGNTKCKMCHIKQFKSWDETKHAKAFDLLKSASKEAVTKMATALKVELKGPAYKNDDCVVCHVTGFELAGGYPAADSVKTAAVASVSCEACHGPGSLHVKAKMAEKKNFINGAVTANMCTQCHTDVTSPKFDFAKMKSTVHVMNAAK